MGDTLGGRYRLGRQIGTGGMATVYEGEDTSLGRRIAIKVLHAQYVSDEAFVARFEREARAVAGIKHPSIVDVYDIGQDGDRYYIIMEYVEGRSLKELVRSGPLSADQTIDVGIQVAKALDFAHQAGVIHRDVKSHNILVSPEGGTKLVDFGIAVAKGTSTVTEAGTILGTVHYIAPEQARGEPAIPASDLYSLGVVLYEMATGRLPFEGDSPIEIATKHVSEPPRRPSSINPNVPANLERAILHAMEKHPADRPADGGALVRELLLAPDDIADQPTRVVAASPRPAARPAAVSAPPLAARPPVERPRPARTVEEREASSTWPIVVLAALAAILVLGLIPLWSMVLRG